MSDFLNTMATLFGFLYTQLGNIASFFITNTLGQVILGIIVFSIIVELIMKVFVKMKG